MTLKKYLDRVDNTTFMARPYELDEDMTYIHHGQHVPELGDMVAYREDDPINKFLISKVEFESDFEEVV